MLQTHDYIIHVPYPLSDCPSYNIHLTVGVVLVASTHSRMFVLLGQIDHLPKIKYAMIFSVYKF